MYPIVFERNKYNGLITLLSLYPIKYLNELCLPYCSFLETNLLLTSISSILNIFCFYFKSRFFDIFIIKVYVLSIHSYIRLKKIYNNLGIHTLIIFFVLCLSIYI